MKNQIGFREKMGCQPNIIKIFNEFNRNKKEYEKAITFIDFKGVYNRVDHEILFESITSRVKKNS